jgi:tRNA-splicing ligase RtcB
MHGEKQRQRLLNFVLASTSFGLGAETHGLDHPVMHESLWDELDILKRLKPTAQAQLGSSGGGNHFADVMIVNLLNGANHLGLITHSGSRGTGKQVAEYYDGWATHQTQLKYKGVPRGYSWLDLDTDLGKEYWMVMELMLRYARANHVIIHERFGRQLGETPVTNVFNSHNFAAIEDGLVVHRKGATPAHIGDYGTIPGSSGTNTYLVSGKGNPDSLYSASHGAGRVSSRSKAKENFVQAKFDERMSNITFHGVDHDESYMAYKDIDQVMEAQKDLVNIEGVCYPLVVVMGGGGKKDYGDGD